MSAVRLKSSPRINRKHRRLRNAATRLLPSPSKKILKMRLHILLSVLVYSAVLEANVLKSKRVTEASCELTASSSDDAPQFLAAAASCDTVIIPAGTTLNIETRLDMTGLSNLNIVSFTHILQAAMLTLSWCTLGSPRNNKIQS